MFNDDAFRVFRIPRSVPVRKHQTFLGNKLCPSSRPTPQIQFSTKSDQRLPRLSRSGVPAGCNESRRWKLRLRRIRLLRFSQPQHQRRMHHCRKSIRRLNLLLRFLQNYPTPHFWPRRRASSLVVQPANPAHERPHRIKTTTINQSVVPQSPWSQSVRSTRQRRS